MCLEAKNNSGKEAEWEGNRVKGKVKDSEELMKKYLKDTQ